MRARTIVIGITCAAATAAGVAGIAAAQADTSSSGHSGHGSRFTVVERATTDTTVDTGPAGDSLGDVLAFSNPIYDAPNNKLLGSDNGSCIRTKVASSYECAWTVTLSGGSITVEGPFYDTADSTLAVTGGTGRYAGAGGAMTLHARDTAGSAYDFGFDLTNEQD